MDSIYQVIQNQPGVDFARLVDRFSDDKRCRWIESLQTTSEFEEAAFSLAKGEISKPFFTPEGIHILKVIDRKEVPAYEVVSDSLLNRLRRQPLDKGTEAIVEQLKKEYQWVSHVDTASLFMLAVLPFTPTSFLHLAFGISDFDEKRYLLTLLAGKSVMVAMMALFGQSLLSSLKNPVYLILAIAIWAGMYWVSRKFCKKHDLD